jgi:SAM-dependent methyltransferase
VGGQAEKTRQHWKDAAPRWRQHGALVRELTDPVSAALVEAARPAAGESWLDVASGVGDPADRMAKRVRPTGSVVATDLVHEMVLATADALSGEVAGVVAAAEALPFVSAFDGASCRFGAMFFADPPRALGEIRNSLKPGGRAVFAVWGAPERNPFFSEVGAAVRDVVPDAPRPEPDDPHGFRYAPAGKLVKLLRAAGWIDVDERTVSFDMSAPLELDELWDFMLGMSPDLEKLVDELPPDLRVRLRRGLEERMSPFFRTGTSRFPAEARLVLAHNPRQTAA